jgi:hypothetical protein
MWFEPEYVPRERTQLIWLIISTQKTSQRHISQQMWHPMLERKNVVVWYQNKSWLCCGKDVKRWFSGTKTTHVCDVDDMFENAFGISRKIMLVPQIEC